ncbi:expressed unknown protein [Seminavis robusta]|uniref:G-protein coupled receptors family 3 profile domain-containing protein n=1 Tax=Seminavis robusta TaxID=568900 RepID=A0A9N8EQU8_9STRA|nr:expressed unknown protein [Seminavis robusta]
MTDGTSFDVIQQDTNDSTESYDTALWGSETDDTQSTSESQRKLPFAIVGPLLPSEGQVISEVAGGGMGIVHISGAAHSSKLSGSPLFARTVTTAVPHCEAVMEYLASLGVSRIANVFFISVASSTSIEISGHLHRAASKRNIDFLRLAMEPGLPSVMQAMSQLKESGIKYVVALLAPQAVASVAKIALQQGVIGNSGYVWDFFGRAELLSPNFGLDRASQADIAQAFHGVSVSLGAVPPSPNFNQVYQQFTSSPTEQEQFLSSVPPADRQYFQNYTFQPTHSVHPLHLMSYDAVIAAGLAACHTPGQFNGTQLHRQIIYNTTFEGLSGHIHFDPVTGTRPTAPFAIKNLVLSDSRSDNATLRFDVRTTAVVVGTQINAMDPFIYHDNSTTPPADKPPLEGFDYNLRPVGVQIFGMIISISMGLMVWTIWNRRKFVISAAQPVFLLQLCIGTITMACAIIPATFQSETPSSGMDAACMSFVWLFALGWMTSISAILSKTWRLGQLMDGSQGMRRLKVEPMDVAKPFFMLLVWNVALLTAWTIVSPLKYIRTVVEHNVDQYGRHLESHARCQRTDNWALLFASLIAAASLVGIAFASFQLYKVRNLSTYFSETTSLLWSMASLVESGVLFIPLLIALHDNSSAYYIGISALITLTSLSFLVPIFWNKLQHRNAQYSDAKEDERRVQEQTFMVIALESNPNGYDSDGGSSTAGSMRLKRHNSSGRMGSSKSTFSFGRSNRNKRKGGGLGSAFGPSSTATNTSLKASNH